MNAIKVASFAALTASSVLCFHTGAAHAQQAGAPVEQQQGYAQDAQGYPAQPAYPAQQAYPQQPQAYPQQQGYPQQQAYPPGYGPPAGDGYQPPPAYGTPAAPPPQRYSYYPPPPPPAPRSTLDRPLMIGGSLGIGGLHYHDFNDIPTSDVAGAYSLRLGFGVAPRSLLLLEINGAFATVSDPYGDLVYGQSLYDVGFQTFLTRALFIRGGIGLGNITTSDSSASVTYFGKAGLGLTASVGAELLQGYNWSLELAGQMIAGFYKDENWTSYAVNLGFNFF